jgi:phage terminase large subunit-like protein
MFKRQWFTIVETAPSTGQRLRYWDQAATSGAGAYTAGVLMLAADGGRYFVEDVVRGQWSAFERDRVILRTAEADKAKYGRVEQWFEMEPGSGGKESAETKVKLLAGHVVHLEKVMGAKEVRAEPFAKPATCGSFVAIGTRPTSMRSQFSWKASSKIRWTRAAERSTNWPAKKTFWIRMDGQTFTGDESQTLAPEERELLGLLAAGNVIK